MTTSTTCSSKAVEATKVDSIAALVPEPIRNSGTLVVGVNVPYSPNEYKDPSGKIVGYDVDLMNAVAGVLGLKAEFKEADFDKIIPAIQQGTYNVGASSFTDDGFGVHLAFFDRTPGPAKARRASG